MRTGFKILLLFIFAISFTSCISYKKSNMEFVDTSEIKNRSDFSAINLPTIMVKSIIIKSLKKDGEEQGTINLIKGIKKAKILSIGNPSEKVFSDFLQFNEANAIQELLTVNNNEDKIIIYGKEVNGDFNRLILAINSKQENDLVFIDVKGKFTEDMIMDLNLR